MLLFTDRFNKSYEGRTPAYHGLTAAVTGYGRDGKPFAPRLVSAPMDMSRATLITVAASDGHLDYWSDV